MLDADICDSRVAFATEKLFDSLNLFLGYPNTSYNTNYTKGFEIFLHESGQFWPGMEMERIGQTKSIYVNTNSELWVSFTLIQKNNLNKVDSPCITDSSYSFTDCMLQYVARTSGCHLDWVGRYQDEQCPPCRTKYDLLNYHGVLNQTSNMPWKQLTNISQCYAKCSYKEFSFSKVISVYVIHFGRFMSKLFL